MTTMRKQGGFTLIELMIVIAILAILMAIAVPVYQDYSVRTKNSECVSVVGGAKLAVSEAINEGATDFTDTGWTFSGSQYCASAAIDGTSGDITATTQDTGASALQYTFSPSTDGGGHIDWNCTTDNANSDRQIPSECR